MTAWSGDYIPVPGLGNITTIAGHCEPSIYTGNTGTGGYVPLTSSGAIGGSAYPSHEEFARLLQGAQMTGDKPIVVCVGKSRLLQGAQMTGDKPIVVCAGKMEEAKTMELAQSAAERLAHQHQADAYILKPVRKVAPKRDVVTTELA